ncbi:MAG: hypothetical protein AAFZ49_08605 [Cyanobacteria bacterium J06659_2]
MDQKTVLKQLATDAAFKKKYPMLAWQFKNWLEIQSKRSEKGEAIAQNTTSK